MAKGIRVHSLPLTKLFVLTRSSAQILQLCKLHIGSVVCNKAHIEPIYFELHCLMALFRRSGQCMEIKDEQRGLARGFFS